MGRSISARCSNCFTTLITSLSSGPGKYKTLSQDKRRGGQWLRKMKIVTPRMFVHWRVAGQRLDNGSGVNREVHAPF